MKAKRILLTSTVVLVLVALFGFIGISEIISSKRCRYKVDCIKRAELSYWKAREDLVNEVDSYIKSVAPNSALEAFILIEECEKFSIDIKFVLAQAELESCYGTKGLASKTNSVWNLGAFDAIPYERILGRYKYNNPNASIRPYLIQLHETYIVDGVTEYDLLNKFINNQGKRYASDPKYESNLNNIYNKIKDSTRIDEYQEILRFYSIKSNRY